MSSISVIGGICCVSRETRAEFCQGQALNFYSETTRISTFEHKHAVPVAYILFFRNTFATVCLGLRIWSAYRVVSRETWGSGRFSIFL